MHMVRQAQGGVFFFLSSKHRFFYFFLTSKSVSQFTGYLNTIEMSQYCRLYPAR